MDIKIGQARREIWQQLSVGGSKKDRLTEQRVKEIVINKCAQMQIPMEDFLNYLQSKQLFWERIDASRRHRRWSPYCTVALANAENIFAACRPSVYEQ